MEKQTIERITKWVLGLALPLVIVAFAVGGIDTAIGAIAGAALSVINVLALRWFVTRILAAGDRARAVLMLLLVVKMSAILGLAAFLLSVVDALGFTIGFAAFVGGVLIGALHAQLTQTGDEDLSSAAVEKD